MTLTALAPRLGRCRPRAPRPPSVTLPIPPIHCKPYTLHQLRRMLHTAELEVASVQVAAAGRLARVRPTSRRLRQHSSHEGGVQRTDSATCVEGGGWDVEQQPSEALRRRCDIDQVLAHSEGQGGASAHVLHRACVLTLWVAPRTRHPRCAPHAASCRRRWTPSVRVSS